MRWSTVQALANASEFETFRLDPAPIGIIHLQ